MNSRCLPGFLFTTSYWVDRFAEQFLQLETVAISLIVLFLHLFINRQTYTRAHTYFRSIILSSRRTYENSVRRRKPYIGFVGSTPKVLGPGRPARLHVIPVSQRGYPAPESEKDLPVARLTSEKLRRAKRSSAAIWGPLMCGGPAPWNMPKYATAGDIRKTCGYCNSRQIRGLKVCRVRVS